MKYLILITLLIFYSKNFAQDDIIEASDKFTMGIGYELNVPTYGLHFLSYYKGFNFGATYILPSSSNKNNAIKEINNGLTIKMGFAPLLLDNNKYVFPIYIGLGYSFINEKNKVLEFHGKGHINSYHYFIGIRVLPNKSDFWGRFGADFEIGGSSWNYNNSILKKNNSTSNYNYSKLFGSIGLYYYIL